MTQSVSRSLGIASSTRGEPLDENSELRLLDELANALVRLETMPEKLDAAVNERALAAVAAALQRLEAFRARTPKVLVRTAANRAVSF